ncbi:hypothetical protein KEM55_004729, partial [Ascosphaera atra]
RLSRIFELGRWATYISIVRTKPPLPRLDSADSKGGGAYDAGVGGGAVESPDVEGHTHPNPGTTAGSRQSQSRRYSHSSSSRHSLRSNQPVSSSHYHGPATRQPLPHAYSYTYAPYSQHPSTKTGAMTAGGDLEHPPRPRSQSQMQLIPERRELERPRSSGNDGGHGLGLYDVESGRGRASAESKRSESAVGKVGYSQYGHGHFYQHRSRAGFEGGGGSGAPSGRNSVDNGAGDDRKLGPGEPGRRAPQFLFEFDMKQDISEFESSLSDVPERESSASEPKTPTGKKRPAAEAASLKLDPDVEEKQTSPKKPKLSASPTKAADLPTSLEDASEEDKLMLRMKDEEGAGWVEIHKAWEEAAGKKVGKSTLRGRYAAIKAKLTPFDKEDAARLLRFKQEVEEKFEREKWGRIAGLISGDGGGSYAGSVLQRKHRELVTQGDK